MWTSFDLTMPENTKLALTWCCTIAMVHFHNKYLILPRHLGSAQVIFKKANLSSKFLNLIVFSNLLLGKVSAERIYCMTKIAHVNFFFFFLDSGDT